MSATNVREPGFSLRVEAALEIRAPQESITAVKSAVIKELELLDSSVKIRDTSYFNHTFAPDLLLTWSDSSTRSVFLRFTDDLQRMADGLAQLDTADPLVLGLSTPIPEADGYGALDASARASEALITDVSGVERIVVLQQRDAGVSLLGQALTQGGRGFIDQEIANRVAEDVSEGFDAAAELGVVSTATAVSTLDGYLAKPQASKMIRVLQAIWEGNEGSADQFPGPRDLSGRLSTDSLQYILDAVSADDNEFWQRIGRGLTLEQLTNLSLSKLNSANFQQLVTSNLDVIHARAAVVRSTPSMLGSGPDSFHWTIRGGNLSLEADDFIASVGETRESIDNAVSVVGKGVSIKTLTARAAAVKLTEVTLRDEKASVQFTSQDDVTRDPRLSKLARDFSSSTLVEKAVGPIEGTQLSFNFTNNVANVQSRSFPLMAHVLQVALPLFLDFDEARHAKLRSFLQVPDVKNRAQVEDLLTLLAEKVDATPKEGSVRNLVLKWMDAGILGRRWKNFGRDRTRFWRWDESLVFDLSQRSASASTTWSFNESSVSLPLNQEIGRYDAIKWSDEARGALRQWQVEDTDALNMLPGLLFDFPSTPGKSRPIIAE